MVKKNIDVVFKFSKGPFKKNKKVHLDQSLAAGHFPSMDKALSLIANTMEEGMGVE